MAEASKDTIYIDIDDEITGIIDKVRSSDGKIVALVLPKRATVFQSIVNMKLLKRGAEQAKKHIVLITSEAGLLPLAGATGIHVASSLASKPEIPSAPQFDENKEETVEETASLLDDEPEEEFTTDNAADKSVGDLAAGAALPLAADGVETIMLDDDATPEDAAADEKPSESKQSKKAAKKKGAKGNKLKVPNFERFRLILILAIVAIILIVGLVLIFSVLPKATIDIKTDAANVNTNVNLALDTSATSLNPQTNTVPAKQVTEQKTYTATVNATGQQNNGQTATGSIVMTTQECISSGNIGTPSTIPAGTGVTANGKTYITQDDANFSYAGNNRSCVNYTSNSVGISAQSAGSSYNTNSNSTTFSVAGNAGVSATGSASGGTDNIQTVVQQSDISNAESKLNTSGSSIKTALEQQLQGDNLYAIPATFTNSPSSATPSAAAGTVANSVTVTETVNYAMYGAPENDLNTLLDDDIKSQVNTQSQGILSTGLPNASFTTNGSSNTSLTMTTTAEVGPAINVSAIKKQAAGKNASNIESSVKSDPDVTGVSVHFSPFWVSSAPKNVNKITVTVAKPTTTASNANNT